MKLYKIYRAIFLFVCLLATGSKLFAGNEPVISGNNSESVLVITDRDLYIAGEPILFSAEYFINGSKSISQLSNILYVELISVTGNQSLLQKKYKIENHFVAGVLNIPADVASGVYSIAAYTQYQRNFPEEFYGYQTIIILNPNNDKFFSVGNSEKRLTNGLDSGFVPLTLNENIIVETEKEKYGTREKVKAKISCNLADDENPVFVSVSVVKQGTHKEDHGFLPSVYNLKQSESKVLKNEYTLNYIPEIRDVSITGKLLNKQTLQPVANLPVYSSVLFNNPQLHVTRTKDDGTFVFSLNNLEGVNDVFISPEVLPGDSTDYKILLNNPFSNSIAGFTHQKSFIDSSDVELVQELFVNAQIRKKFCPTSLQDSIARNKTAFANINDFNYSILLSDFVSLKSMEELFVEIINLVRIRKDRNQYSFIVFDENGNVVSENPLLLLDKIPVFDANVILGLDISQIEKVELINRPYLLGENSFMGILAFTTKNGELDDIPLPESSVFVEFQAIEPAVGLADFYSNCNAGQNRIPDFRTTLYWNPRVKLTGNGIELEFEASDDQGVYSIVVKGMNQNAEPFYARKTLVVKN